MLKLIGYIIGTIVFIISLPFLGLGMIGIYLLFTLPYFGIPLGDDDYYASGTYRGLPKL